MPRVPALLLVAPLALVPIIYSFVRSSSSSGSGSSDAEVTYGASLLEPVERYRHDAVALLSE